MQAKELKFITIGGSFYGGDQNWNRHWLMRLGGCSTTTACEACICLARDHAFMRPLYPFDLEEITVEDFRDFSEMMFPFVHPGVGGLTNIEKYAAKLREYVCSRGVHAQLETLAGSQPAAAAERFIESAIDAGLPVAYLMLRHRDVRYDELEWHWFSVTGYERGDDCFHVTAATYGRRFRLDLGSAWDTGHAWKGGLVVMRPPAAESK